MYQQCYAEIAGESPKSARANERKALEVAIEKLSIARERGPMTPECFEATDFLRRLWTVFMLDLGSEGNGLPESLRASLISIGIWVRREADLIDTGGSQNFDSLIEVNQLIADGLV